MEAVIGRFNLTADGLDNCYLKIFLVALRLSRFPVPSKSLLTKWILLEVIQELLG